MALVRTDQKGRLKEDNGKNNDQTEWSKMIVVRDIIFMLLVTPDTNNINLKAHSRKFIKQWIFINGNIFIETTVGDMRLTRR